MPSLKRINSSSNNLLKTLYSPKTNNITMVTTDSESDTNANANANANANTFVVEDPESTWENVITLETFNDWINVSSYKIECLDLAIKTYRWRLQNFILLGLLLSTLSGTISVTQFGNYPVQLRLVLNWALTITSFSVALLTGAVKTFKLQETLEEYIHLKQNWVSFSAKISNEIYLPKRLRRNAEELIKENKGKFLDLLKIDIPIPKHMSILAAKHIDKGDDIESQYYRYRDNIIKNEKAMNEGCMKCLSFWYNFCFCFYNEATAKKIEDNNALAKIIKYSQIENATTYKRKAYQYTLSSIMLNNVKNEYKDIKLETDRMKTTETQIEANDYLNSEKKYNIIIPRASTVASASALDNTGKGEPLIDFSKMRLSITEKIIDTFVTPVQPKVDVKEEEKEDSLKKKMVSDPKTDVLTTETDVLTTETDVLTVITDVSQLKI